MKVLVTGGAGYIGSFMVKRLLNEGYEVITIDNLGRGHRKAVDARAKFLVGDLHDEQFLEHVFCDLQFDAVMHFAGYISMEESVEKPGIYFANNVFSALNILNKMREFNVNNFIFSSTAGVYGDPVKIPIPEDHPTSPLNPYGESKLMVERVLSWYRMVYGISFMSLRYFNAAGASLDGSMGEDHQPETHIIPNAISATLNEGEFILYGDDYETADGTCVRDYIHVIDLVDAHILALKALKKKGGAFFYNVGTGRGYSNREVIEMVKWVSEKDFKVKVKDRRPGDAGVLIADPTKIKNELGFSPKYSDLETIVETAWKWHKSHPDGYSK